MPNENRSTTAEYEKRLLIVSEMLLSGLRRREIIENINSNDLLKWDVSDAMIDVYISDAKVLISESYEKDKAKLTQSVLTRYEYLYRKQLNVKDYKGAILALDKIVALTGIAAPDKHELSGKDGEAIKNEHVVVFRKMNTKPLPDAD